MSQLWVGGWWWLRWWQWWKWRGRPRPQWGSGPSPSSPPATLELRSRHCRPENIFIDFDIVIFCHYRPANMQQIRITCDPSVWRLVTERDIFREQVFFENNSETFFGTHSFWKWYSTTFWTENGNRERFLECVFLELKKKVQCHVAYLTILSILFSHDREESIPFLVKCLRSQTA